MLTPQPHARPVIRFVAAAALLAVAALPHLRAQDVMMQGWYWDYPKATGANAWSANLTARANQLGGAGFTHLWLPPLSRASFGFNSNGYDPKDLYDLGEYGLGPTGFGTRAQVDATVAALSAAGISAVADVVYNHRDGGAPEVNPAVGAYITTHYTAAKEPMPSDRWFCRLPLGGSSGNGAGDYYLKISSKTGAQRFSGSGYKVYARTSLSGQSFLGVIAEDEANGGAGNGGGDCGEGFNVTQLGYDFTATLDDPSTCRTDELKLTLTAADFAAAGDYLEVFLTNTGGYSDHRIYGIWNAAAAQDVAGQLEYLTYTDFTAMPSGQGAMDFEAFRPNTATAATTYLSGDWDSPLFFYDYDQDNAQAQAGLTDWTDWLLGTVGIGGLRMDAVKHFDPAFVPTLLNGLSTAPGLVVGEFFDSDAGALASWVSAANVGNTSGSPVRVFDFALREALKNACDNGGYDVRNVFQSGVVDGAGLSGFNSVTFVNNHDFRYGGQPVQSDPLLAYAYLLTNNRVGLPCVFYPDYFGVAVPNAPTVAIQSELDGLIGFQATEIAGATQHRYLNANGSAYAGTYLSGSAPASDVLVYQLGGMPSGRDVVVAINFGTQALKLDQTLDLTGGITPGTRFDDVFGRSAFPFAIVSGAGELYLEVPARSYAVWQAAAAPLPVEVVSLTAKRLPGEQLDVRWRVGAERDLAAYRVEVRTDRGARLTLGETPARGESAYAKTFRDPFPGEDLYVRLVRVDRDGAEERGDAVHVPASSGRPDNPTAYPTPARGRLTVETPGPWRAARVELLDASGRTVRADLADAPRRELSLAGLPAGAYRLRLTRAGAEPRLLPVVVR